MNEQDKNRIRQRVRRAIQRRMASGATRQQVAESIGVHSITLWKWERGDIGDGPLSLLSLVLDDAPAETAQPDQPTVAPDDPVTRIVAEFWAA